MMTRLAFVFWMCVSAAATWAQVKTMGDVSFAVPAGWEDSRAYPAGCLRSLEYAHEFIGYVHLCKTMRGIRMPRAI